MRKIVLITCISLHMPVAKIVPFPSLCEAVHPPVTRKSTLYPFTRIRHIYPALPAKVKDAHWHVMLLYNDPKKASSCQDLNLTLVGDHVFLNHCQNEDNFEKMMPLSNSRSDMSLEAMEAGCVTGAVKAVNNINFCEHVLCMEAHCRYRTIR